MQQKLVVSCFVLPDRVPLHGQAKTKHDTHESDQKLDDVEHVEIRLRIVVDSLNSIPFDDADIIYCVLILPLTRTKLHVCLRERVLPIDIFCDKKAIIHESKLTLQLSIQQF